MNYQQCFFFSMFISFEKLCKCYFSSREIRTSIWFMKNHLNNFVETSGIKVLLFLVPSDLWVYQHPVVRTVHRDSLRITEILQKLDRFHSFGDICAVYRKQTKQNLFHFMDLFQLHWCSIMMFLIHRSPNPQQHSSVSPHFYFKQHLAIALFSEDVLNYTLYSRTNILKLWSKDSNALLPLLQHKGHHCQPTLKN